MMLKHFLNFVGLDKNYLDETIKGWENPDKQKKVYDLIDKLKIEAN